MTGSGATRSAGAGRTFCNPLYPRPFADPFVLKFNGLYYAYGTPGCGRLPVLRSSDLVSWDNVGEVLEPPDEGMAHWAPEVAYDNGRFFLYYSTGGHEGERHRLRVAGGTWPTGPFDENFGLLDPADDFTIDAHPFLDDDGRWYLFYSRDFLEGEPVGTGIVVDRLVDMTTLAGERKTVMRPHADWHLYEKERRWYDRVWDWYTVEGPFVRKHDNRYWCFYSGGAWKAENYGISSAVADHPMGPYEPVVAADTADVLRTVAGKVIGPGHGSVAVAPDNVTEYLVYHAWDLEQTGRFLHIDRLMWDEDRPKSPGPRVEPQPCPPAPTFRDLIGEATPAGDAWTRRGRWSFQHDRLVHPGAEAFATAVLKVTVPTSFLLELNVAMPGEHGTGRGSGALIAYHDDQNHTAVIIDPPRRLLRWHVIRDGEVEESGELGRLRPDFAAGSFHQLMLRQGSNSIAASLDGVSLGSMPQPRDASGAAGVWTGQGGVVVTGVTLTELP